MLTLCSHVDRYPMRVYYDGETIYPHRVYITGGNHALEEKYEALLLQEKDAFRS